ncbi:putative membrane protein [Afipia felis]|uniref:Membrane protein n=1 Tax=Afipia felis TaxID=1035 RepID=A0A090MU09_AFIFE|nr:MULTISPECIES: DUF1634 domain-containing protein [Afipia]EFI51396.1 protein of unknown function DUF1634 [Afipia sp. 1NLS2]CEG09144.1 putative membrane protein [Afipia felis]
MTENLAKHALLERRISKLLEWGTWIGCAIVSVGITMGLFAAVEFQPVSVRLVSIGIAIFIAMPILGVAVMTLTFIRDEDTVFAIISFLVLLIIGLGAAIGVLHVDSVL